MRRGTDHDLQPHKGPFRPGVVEGYPAFLIVLAIFIIVLVGIPVARIWLFVAPPLAILFAVLIRWWRQRHAGHEEINECTLHLDEPKQDRPNQTPPAGRE